MFIFGSKKSKKKYKKTEDRTAIKFVQFLQKHPTHYHIHAAKASAMLFRRSGGIVLVSYSPCASLVRFFVVAVCCAIHAAKASAIYVIVYYTGAVHDMPCHPP